jgi:hypothetical protein
LATNLALILLSLVPFTPFIALGLGGTYYVMKRRARVSAAEATSQED